jgi:nickel transport protein
MKKCLLLLCVSTLLFVSVLNAHDTYVIKEGNAFVIMHGHDGKSDPYNPQFIKAAKAYDVTGNEMPVTMNPEESCVLLDISQPPALVTLTYATGPKVKTAEGWKDGSKREVKDAIESKKWVKNVKQIMQWNDQFGQPRGAQMEVVP